VLIAALATGASIIFAALWKGIAAHRIELATAQAEAPVAVAVAAPSRPQLSPIGRFERFLVTSDGSEYSAGAVRVSLRMAQKCGARVRVISIVAGGNAELYAMGEQLLARELDTARAHLNEVQQEAATLGVACETEVVQAGDIHKEIVSQADQMNADLIIMGRRGRRGLARLMLGDVTAQVIGHAHCSVLVVPRAAELPGRHFIVASDGSRFGDAAAAAAGSLAKLCQTPITVVSTMLASHSEQRREEARQAVNRVTSFLKQENVAVEGRLLEGRPDELIVETASDKQADLIVVGSHGRTGIERILLGSTTERVLNQSKSAVLVVRAA
jgi:nucleotide-binding universal stress UspA family protein